MEKVQTRKIYFTQLSKHFILLYKYAYITYLYNIIHVYIYIFLLHVIYYFYCVISY